MKDLISASIIGGCPDRKFLTMDLTTKTAATPLEISSGRNAMNSLWAMSEMLISDSGIATAPDLISNSVIQRVSSSSSWPFRFNFIFLSFQKVVNDISIFSPRER